MSSEPSRKTIAEILAAEAAREAEANAAVARVRAFANAWHVDDTAVCHLRDGATLTISDLITVLDRLDSVEDEVEFLRPRATGH
jgi:hypothetical protein